MPGHEAQAFNGQQAISLRTLEFSFVCYQKGEQHVLVSCCGLNRGSKFASEMVETVVFTAIKFKTKTTEVVA
jgi:hypothetical protein